MEILSVDVPLMELDPEIWIIILKKSRPSKSEGNSIINYFKSTNSSSDKSQHSIEDQFINSNQ